MLCMYKIYKSTLLCTKIQLVYNENEGKTQQRASQSQAIHRYSFFYSSFLDDDSIMIMITF